MDVNEGSEVCGEKAAGIGGQREREGEQGRERERGRQGVIWVSA